MHKVSKDEISEKSNYETILKGITIGGQDGAGADVENVKQQPDLRSSHPQGSQYSAPADPEDRRRNNAAALTAEAVFPVSSPSPFKPGGPRNRCVWSSGARRDMPGLHPQTPKENAGPHN